MLSSSSTSSLLSSRQPPSSSENWEKSFGKLSSSLGLTGSVPSLPQKSSSKSTKTSLSVSPSPSTQPSTSPSPKDYERTFALLSSSYGFCGSYPTIPSKVPKSKTRSTSQSSPLTVKSSGKDYEQLLGDLLVSNGFADQCLSTRL